MVIGNRQACFAPSLSWMMIDPELGKSALMGEGLCPSPFLIT